MKKQVLLAFAALALSGAASAQVYGVVSAGVSKHDVDCADTVSCDKSGSAFKVLGGYKFNPNVALEGGYMSFGKTKAVVNESGVDVDLGLNVSGIGIGAAFQQDFATNWNFVGRLGLAQMKSKLTASAGGFSASDSDSKTKLYGGLGIGYKLTKQLSLDAAWDFSQGEFQGEKGSVSALSLGLTFGF
jgi:OmpA-OmpF porin, OOP family